MAVPVDLPLFSGLHGHCTHMFLPIHRQIYTHIFKNNKDIIKLLNLLNLDICLVAGLLSSAFLFNISFRTRSDIPLTIFYFVQYTQQSNRYRYKCVSLFYNVYFIFKIEFSFIWSFPFLSLIVVYWCFFGNFVLGYMPGNLELIHDKGKHLLFTVHFIHFCN